MRKITSLLMLFCAFVGMAWAQEGLQAIEVTTNPEAPVYYTIKNVRGNAYAVYDGANKTILLRPNVETSASLFYFTEGETEGTYKIHNSVNAKMCANYNSWTDGGIEWYIKQSGNKNYTGYAISKDAELKGAWNDNGNQHTSVAGYDGNDDGSVWAIEKYVGAAPGLQLSTDANIVLYNIRSVRQDSYVNFEGHNVTFKEGAMGAGSYWYFVKDESATDVPEGYVAVKIFNAAHATAVENHKSGFMGTNQWPASTYYIGLHEVDNYGYAIRRNDGEKYWNDEGGKNVCDYWVLDNGSLWRLYPATKTVEQLKAEASTAKTNAPAFFTAAEEADFYSYSDEAIASAKSTVEGADVETLVGATNVLLALEKLNKTKGTTAPVAGQYIQLKNRNYNKYLKANDGDLTSIESGDDLSTLWLVEEGTDGNVKLKNFATGKYIGQIRESEKVLMVDAENAKQFAITNQTECYAVFHETTGGGYAFGHIASSNVLVGWEKGAGASQWIISDYLAKVRAELQEAYNDAVNNVGVAVGMYKETESFLAKKAIVENVLANPEDNKDVVALLEVLESFNAACASSVIAMAPGYYFVKGTGGMGGPAGYVTPNKEWVLTHEGKDVMKGVELGEGQKLNANHIWKFETCEDGYKLQQVNLGTYANLIAAGGTSTINGDSNSGDKFTLTPVEGSSCKFIIKNGGGHVMRTEDDGRVNYWGTENKESWYLIPATELEVEVANAYGSIYLPFDVTLAEGQKAYAVTATSETSATLTEMTDIPAGEGAILAQGTYTLNIAEATSDWSDNKLEGTNVNTYIAGPAYVLGLVDGEVVLAKAALNKDADGNEGETHFLNNANKAYLPKTVKANVLRFNFGGNTTAIESVVNGLDVNAPIYDLSGRRVNVATKGIYIQNGKKFIVK